MGSWKDDARRTAVSDKNELKSFPEYWVKVKKYSIKGKDEINTALRKVQQGLDKKALVQVSQKASKGFSEENILEKLSPEEMAVILDGQTAGAYDLMHARIKNGIAAHNFCEGDIRTRYVDSDKDIENFAKDILEFPDIAEEIIKLIESFNRPLAQKRSKTSETLPNGSTTEQNLTTEKSSQTEEIQPS